jgi:hypothetical protein
MQIGLSTNPVEYSTDTPVISPCRFNFRPIIRIDTASRTPGYYKVTETTVAANPSFLWVPSKSYIFAAEIKKQNDSAVQLYQSMRSPPVYWTYDFGLSINYNLNDSLTNGSAPAWGRIINDSTVNFHYVISNCIGCSTYTVTQQWTKLQNAADTALYGFKDTVRNEVTTFAGSTFKGDPVVATSYGDGGPAVAANLSAPVCVIMDAAGNVYVGESGHNTVRKIDANGIISLVAGTYNWEGGYSGDGGPATSALLSYPDGLAVNKEGDLFIADYYNQVIRRVDHATGIITTFAGTGKAGYSNDNGPATLAQLSSPAGMAFDGNDNLYLADVGNNVIRKITPSGVITTIAGSWVTTLYEFGNYSYCGDYGPALQAAMSPYFLCVDQQGNLLVADYYNNRIRKVFHP